MFSPLALIAPITTFIGVLGLTTQAIAEIRARLIILPVGRLSIIGWFWFNGHTFATAWNPHGISWHSSIHRTGEH